jgi:pilus assembly protein Flp/PilA
MIRAALRLFADRRGVTAIEYGLIAGGIAMAILGSVITVGSELNTFFFVAVDAALLTVPGTN